MFYVENVIIFSEFFRFFVRWYNLFKTVQVKEVQHSATNGNYCK